MMSSATLFLMLTCHFVFAKQTCLECMCCMNGEHACSSNKECIDGCVAGYYGAKCTDKCRENCKTCNSGYHCTECKPGYFGNKCNFKCGKGCINNTCTILLGECSCKSVNFEEGYCTTCSGNKYGDECNNTCPSNCFACSAETDCLKCKEELYYGTFCQHRCSHGCNTGKCHKHNGHCLSQECKPRYTGEKCDACLHGYYGKNCSLHCRKNCSSCISESNCTVCKPGFYGESCMVSCPSGCKGNCSLNDGRCLQCKLGLHGDFCNNTCIDGAYGHNCSKLCRDIDSNCQSCFTNTLGEYDGCTKCNRGYYPNIYQGEKYSICTNCSSKCIDNICNTSGVCTNGCSQGKWGSNCSIDCKSNCIQCNQINGKCSTCRKDKFSDDCSKNCSTYCKRDGDNRVCDDMTGNCLYGCRNLTRFGEHCEKECNETCNNQTCDWKKGNCLKGCVKNYYGTFCEKKCAHTCRSKEDKDICHVDNGYCLFGCKDGFYGDICGNNCSSLCRNTTCQQETGECMYGCSDGYEGTRCVEAGKGAVNDKNKILVIIVVSSGASVALIVLMIIIALCLVKQKRKNIRQHSNRNGEQTVMLQDMPKITEENDEIKSDVTYAQPVKPKKKTKTDSDNANDNKEKVFGVYNDNVLIDETKSAKKNKENNESIEEVYDTTRDNKLRGLSKSGNVYAILNVKSAKSDNFSKAQSEDGHDTYDTTEGHKNTNIQILDNDYDLMH